jgi:hypothetical protein
MRAIAQFYLCCLWDVNQTLVEFFPMSCCSSKCIEEKDETEDSEENDSRNGIARREHAGCGSRH